jgi:hypothetical protein
MYVFIILAITTACSQVAKKSSINDLTDLEGRYTKREALFDLGEPLSCNKNLATEVCTWSISGKNNLSDRVPSSEKSSRVVRFWFDRRGVMIRQSTDIESDNI